MSETINIEMRNLYERDSHEAMNLQLGNSRGIYFTANTYAEYLKFLWLEKHSTTQIKYDKIKVISNLQKFAECIKKWITPTFYGEKLSSSYTVIYNDNIFIQCHAEGNLLNYRAWGTEEEINSVNEKITQTFDEQDVYIRWVYDAENFSSLDLQIPTKNKPFEEMYPFLNGESLKSYYERFMDSDENILLMLGNPGTGKTSFTRGLIEHTKQNAILTYQQEVLQKDGFFAMWFESRTEDLLIVEDADDMLMPRKDGNTLMQKFLNVGDGLASLRNKKIIFTTNLESVIEIDSALTRPGRCHDILHFRPLNMTESNTLLSKINSPLANTLTKKEYTIAELFSLDKERKINDKPKTQFGFI